MANLCFVLVRCSYCTRVPHHTSCCVLLKVGIPSTTAGPMSPTAAAAVNGVASPASPRPAGERSAKFRVVCRYWDGAQC